MPGQTAHLPPQPSRFLPTPTCESARLTLRAVRRMAIGGIHDAYAATAILNAHGCAFRRPLVLLRATMAELATHARRRIVVAPWCCLRMTPDEARILAVLRHAPAEEARARRHLRRLTGVAEAPRVLCAASAYGWALRDLGHPLGSG